MTEITGETVSNRGDHWVTDEARLLAKISEQLSISNSQLAHIRAVLERVEQQAQEGAREFLPALRHLLGRRAVKAAGKMWGGGNTG